MFRENFIKKLGETVIEKRENKYEYDSYDYFDFIQKFGDFINEKDSDWKNNILLESNSNKIDKEYLRDKYNSYIKKCKRSCKPKKVKSGTFGGKTGKQQTVKIRKSKTKNTRKSQK